MERGLLFNRLGVKYDQLCFFGDPAPIEMAAWRVDFECGRVEIREVAA